MKGLDHGNDPKRGDCAKDTCGSRCNTRAVLAKANNMQRRALDMMLTQHGDGIAETLIHF